MSSGVFFGLGFLISLVISGLMTLVGIGDQPDHRSAHKKITPTGGGLGIVAALGLTSLIFAKDPGFYPLTQDYAQVLSLVFAVGFLGLMDDILNLSAYFKFFIMAAISGAAVWAIGPVSHLPFGSELLALPVWFSWLGSILWMFVVMNIVNFMDGSNGLLLIVMGIASVALAWIAAQLGPLEPVILLVVLSSSIIGLAVYNFRREAVVFTGDVGSLTIGFTFAVAVLWIIRDVKVGSPVYIGPVLILPFLADAFLTMLVRARRGEKLIEAHNDHLYQRLIKGGLSHLNVAFLYGVCALLLAGFANMVVGRGLFHYVNVLIFPAFILSGIYWLAGRRFN